VKNCGLRVFHGGTRAALHTRTNPRRGENSILHYAAFIGYAEVNRIRGKAAEKYIPIRRFAAAIEP
jgi:hypothetical protein